MRKLLLFIIISLSFSLSAYSQCGVHVGYTYANAGCRIVSFDARDSTYTTSNYNPVKWKWYFGDGDTATGPTYTHRYSDTLSSTSFDVKLVVTSLDQYNDTCFDSITKTIRIKTIPYVDFFSDPNNQACLSDSVKFSGVSNLGPAGITKWYWDFKDSTSSNLQNPMHLFADTGTYNVSLYITDTSGCSNSVTHSIKVINPAVNFTVNYNPASTLDTVQFSGSSNLNVVAWNWTFGDGATASVQYPTHIFQSLGTYNVTLSAITENLCTPSVTHTETIESLPYVNFSVSGHCLGYPTVFTDYSYPNGGSIQSWYWNFGDGSDSTITTSGSQVSQSGHPTPSHIYTTSGTYVVTLTVTDSHGNTRSRSKDVVISPKPVAKFSYQNTCQYDTTAFYDQTSDTAIDSWQWNLGDGSTAITKNTTHKYLNPGTYSVQLIVMNSYGCGDTTSNNVVIDSLPKVSITMAKNKLCLGEDAQLYGNSTDTVSWHWDLGNGATSNYQNPLPYSYDTSGTYHITLNVVDNHSCSNTVSDSVVVMENPKVDFNYSSQTCKTDSVGFVDKTTTPSGIMTSFNWDFGDTASSSNQTTVQNPKHFFTGGAGSYKVQLLATNSYGCSDSVSKYVKIYDTPKAGFTYIQESSPMTKVSFTDTSKQGVNHSPISSYLWTFYQNDTSQHQNPNYNFPNYGTCYSVTEMVTDTNGCSNTDTTDVCLVPPPPVDYTVSQDSVCLGESITFTGQATNIAKWHWDFGDGDTSNSQNPVYKYDTARTYNVTLSVTDANGYSNSVTHQVSVFGNPKVDYSYGPQTCKTDTVAFANKNTTPSGIMTSFAWNFGDAASASNQSTLQNPKHYFTGGAGSYKVKLIATNSLGCTDSAYKYVKIYDTPKAGFTYIQESSPMTKVSFTDTSKQGINHSPISSYLWTFYQNDTSQHQNPSYDFPNYGACYSVTEMVTDTNGCSNTDTTDVCLVPPPPVDFTISQDSVCLGESITFSGQATGITKWHWDFGNGDTSNYQDPLPHTYPSTGTYSVTLSVIDANGYSNSVTHKVYVFGNPKVDFSYGPQTCKTDTVAFANMTTTPSGGLSSFAWNFGDAASASNQSTLQNPKHYFTGGAGSYKVKLITTNSLGCTDSAYKYVKIYDTPKAGFTYIQQSSPMTKVSFTDTSKQGVNHSPISSYLWTFYQNDTSQHQNPSYDFPNYGTCYSVTEMVTDTNGCSNTDTTDVCLVPPPPVDFTISQDSICLGESITFNGQATSITKWHWDFGDGDTSNYQSQSHQYTKIGTYSVTLKVTNINGYSNSVTHKVYVFGNPKADFNYGNACRTDSVHFLNTTTNPSGILTSFNWDFGDIGSTSNQSTLQNPAHYFSAGAGSYHVKLYVTNNYGCSDTIYKYVKVHDDPKAGFTYIQQSSPMTQVSFTDTSKQSADMSPISSYLWSFYNSDVSSSANPTYNFPSYGQCYPVELTVTDTNGCSNTDTTDVCLLPPPPVDFTISQDTICLGEKITFNGQASNIVSWHWDFGNGDTSDYQSQVYQYPKIGVYTVTLSVVDINGFSNSVTHKVFVSDNPNVDFTYGPQRCQTDSVSFLDKSTVSTGILTSFNWSFGDTASAANQSTKENPKHFFSGMAGSYKVKLLATNSYGCSDSAYKNVKIFDSPKANFTYVQQSSPMTEVQFSDTSQQSRDGSPIVNYLWGFYNGDMSNSAKPTYDFPDYGRCYTVTEMVTDTNGCSNTDTVDVCLAAPPSVDFTPNQDTICLGEKITFSGQASNIVKWHWDFGNGDTSIYQNQVYQYPSAGTYAVTLKVTDLNGFSNSITHKVFVASTPKADFSYGKACQTDSVDFFDGTSSPTGVITAFNWNFGDAASTSNQSAQQNPTHFFTAGAGSYHVKLYVTNNYGCSDTIYKYVKVHDIPKAGFTYIQQNNPMTKVSFTDTSQMSRERSPINGYLWSFYNGDISDSANPSYNFPSYGQCYPVTLTVTDTNGCSNTDTTDVCLLPPPPVDFTISQDTICLGEQITFSGQASDIAKWHWDFGDGDTSSYQNPLPYSYLLQGTYTVTLTVTDINGFTNSISRKVFVSGNPETDFTFGSACQTDSVHFYDMTTTSSGVLTSFNWNFDDLASSSNQSGKQNPAHYFTGGSGSYHVKLYVTNNYGCSDTIYKYVKVHDNPKAGFTYIQQNNPMTTVSFTDTSKMSRERTPINGYLWSFYNGDVSNSANPSYNFPGDGQCYPVTLTVTDTNGCSNTDTTDVCLLPPPPVDFTVSDDSICLGEKITFSGQASNILTWHWDFGDGDTAAYQNPLPYTYTLPGTYSVTLTVTDIHGFSNSVTHKVFVSDNPKADFSYGRACMSDSVDFLNKTTTYSGVLTTFEWNFGDPASASNQSTEQNPAHFFSNGAGSYHVKLYVANNYGCSDSVYKYVKVHDEPKAGFTYSQLGNPMTSVSFTDTSQMSHDRSPITSYLWSFYNGDVSDSVNPTYNFPNDGQCYPVTLTVTDTNDCSNTDTVDVCLVPPPSLSFTETEVCVGNKTHFEASYSSSVDTSGYYYKWDFGDGSNQVYTYYDTITHQFSQPGVYNVEVTAVGTNGSRISVSHKATVDSLPNADFTFVTPSCDQTTTFEAPTWGGGVPIKSWSWDFGDSSSEQSDTSDFWNPSHLYPSIDSTFYVSLTVVNANGCVNTAKEPVARSSCSHVYFIMADTRCSNNATYFKDRTSLNSSLGKIDRWEWDFGDGTTKTYTSHQDSISHVYQSAGSYKVTLKEQATVNNTTSYGSYDTVIVINQSPQANFGFGPACVGQHVYFADSTYAYNSGLRQWQWTFNDLTSTDDTSSLENPDHIYSTAGSYPAQLVVSDDYNCVDTVIKNVVVHGPPTASFNINPNYNGIPGQVYLENTSTGAVSYLWKFGDGSISTDKDPVYQYTSSDPFTAMLIATSQYLCSDTATSSFDLTSGLFVPNSFAPGSDDPKVNKFKPIGVNLRKYDIQIYSPWGILLWESTKLDSKGRPVEGWDGTYKGQPLPSGDYIWRVNAEFMNGKLWKGSDNGDGNKKPYGRVLLIR